MYSKRLFSALGVAAVISAASAGSCNADNCLRALRATTRLPQASTDCAAILDVTVTPSIVTVTEYSTVLETDTSTIPTTLVQTLHDTLTTVVRVTSTVQDSETVTAQPAKRAASDGVPAYASPCSGLVRFSSACSCISVSANTITAAAPSTTVTLPATSTIFTGITEPVETDYETVDDATVTQTTTAATVTTTALTTVTPVPAAPQPISGTVQFALNGQTLYLTNTDSSGLTYATATADASAAVVFTLDTSGQLWYGSKVAKGDPGGLNLQLFFIAPTSGTARTPYTCARDSTSGVLSCGFGDGTADVAWALRSNNYVYAGKSANLVSAGYSIVTLVLV